jgi:hypothetical protein
VYSFTYLGYEANCTNVLSADIKTHSVCKQKHFKSQLISKKTNILYKVLLRPATTCASETWTLTKVDDRALDLFQKKIFRSIFGVLEVGQWRR